MKLWSQHFGKLPPVGHVLRRELPERWLRIHSLPESKRYADTASEYAELLRRHNRVAAEVLGDQADVFLCLHTWGQKEDHVNIFTEFSWASSLSFSEIEIVHPEGEDTPLAVSSSPVLWTKGEWNELIRDVADDRLSSVLLFSPDSGEAYSPYDGGADLFFARPERVTDLRARWADWLSLHPEGL